MTKKNIAKSVLLIAGPVGLLAFCASAVSAQNLDATGGARTSPRSDDILPADQAALASHVMFLASDSLRGREAGSREFEIAAQYVASRFYEAGLRPGGGGGSYLQLVPLVSYAPEKGRMTLTQPARAPISLAFGADYLPSGNPNQPDYKVRAPLVFVGQGITGMGRDDYRGIDARGKIVVMFRGAPTSFPAAARAHFSSGIAKAEIARQHGAIGYIILESPPVGGRAGYSFARAAARWDRPERTWGEADGRGNIPVPSVPRLGTLSLAGAAKLFEGARWPWDKVVAAAATPDPVFKAMPLRGKLEFSVKTRSTTVMSYNVVGLLSGGDPALAKEVVILSAHLDHIGVGKPDARGDAINNGALDNAIGVATLIEEARRFRDSGIVPRRSILFLAVTAEEDGLLGSDYFANNPTVLQENIVADVNLDMPILTYRFEDVTPFGAEHSTLDATVRRAAAKIGVEIGADPRPDEMFFVRSDHYSFVQKGIPSLFLWPGEKGPGKAATDAFFATHYHQPSDDMAQAPVIDWQSGVRFVDINYRIAREIADADQRPQWKKGDLFGMAFGGPMQK